MLVPAHNRPDPLRACLTALAAQTLPPDQFEVIVCDDGTPAPLAEQLRPTLDSLTGTLRVTVLRQERAGPAAARNRAAAHARGRYLAFIDDDCRPAPDWLAALATRFASAPDHLIGGGMLNGLPDNPFSTTTQLIMDAVYAHQAHQSQNRFFFSTSNLALPADGFRRCGGFNEQFRRAAGEDYDLCARWRHHRLPMLYAPEATVRHLHGLGLGSFVRQHFSYGRGLYRMRQRMARRSGRGLRPSPLSLYVALVRHPLRRGLGARGWLLAGLVVVAQAASASGVLQEALLVGGPGPPDPPPIPE